MRGEDLAWNRFSATGNVLDYLKYAAIKNLNNDDLKGVKGYAGQYGWLDNNGKIDI